MVASVIGVGLVGVALGIVGRLLGPRPRPAGIAIGVAAGMVGGELGVLLMWASGQPPGLAWIVGIGLAAAFVGVACGLILWHNGPYPPHDTAPRTIANPNERVRRRRDPRG